MKVLGSVPSTAKEDKCQALRASLGGPAAQLRGIQRHKRGKALPGPARREGARWTWTWAAWLRGSEWPCGQRSSPATAVPSLSGRVTRGGRGPTHASRPCCHPSAARFSSHGAPPAPPLHIRLAKRCSCSLPSLIAALSPVSDVRPQRPQLARGSRQQAAGSGR